MSGVGFKYKNTILITKLGLVDDVIGTTKPDHRAQQLISILKVKTPEKQLQFGVQKCKMILVEKRIWHECTVDEGNVSHKHIIIKNFASKLF